MLIIINSTTITIKLIITSAILLAITLFVFSLTVSTCSFIESNIMLGSVLVSSAFSSFELKNSLSYLLGYYIYLYDL